MTTDKPKWWQNWVVYGVVAMVALMLPYVGGYLLLGEYGYWEGDVYSPGFHYRRFTTATQCVVFRPLARAEATIRREAVALTGEHLIYGHEPVW